MEENKVKKERYFTNKEIVQMAILGAAMLLASCVTVPLVVGIPFPGIRSIVCAPFFGLFIALAYARVPKMWTGTITTLVCGLPMTFMSPVIFAFTILSGFCTDIYFLIVKKKITTATTIGMGLVIMGSMTVIGAILDVLFLNGSTLVGPYQTPLFIAIGFISGTLLGGLGSWLATRIFKEFKVLREQK